MLKTFYLCCFLFLCMVAYAQEPAQFPATVLPLDSSLQEKLVDAGLWQQGCPVPLSDLRLIRVRYYDYAGKTQNGEIIVNKTVAAATAKVFEKLYSDKFPIAAIDTLVSFKGNWRLAEQQNITYGFICNRSAPTKFSQESYGTVITLNPVQNPEIQPHEITSRKLWWCSILPIYHCGERSFIPKVTIFPSAGVLAINRNLKLSGMAEAAVATFTQYGFSWSGKNVTEINWKKFYLPLDELKK